MDKIAECWLWLSQRLHRRPLAVIGLLVGALVWVGLMSWLFVQTENTRDEIQKVQSALCGDNSSSINPGNLPSPVKANCQLLFNRIWDNATPEQISEAKRRLREAP
jgi:predicted PurR-regulated permease PerM